MESRANSVRYLMAVVGILSLVMVTSGARTHSRQSQEKKAKTVTITGCLAKGESASEFSITENGKTYGLMSAKIKLADHLGHKVTVTGVITRAGEGEEGEKGEESGEYADVRVTRLKMVSTSCQ